jgi:hypothetical protein
MIKVARKVNIDKYFDTEGVRSIYIFSFCQQKVQYAPIIYKKLNRAQLSV